MKLITALILTICISCGPPRTRKFEVGQKVLIQNQIEGVITANWGFSGGMNRYRVQYIKDGEFIEVIVVETAIKAL